MEAAVARILAIVVVFVYLRYSTKSFGLDVCLSANPELRAMTVHCCR
jgi:hypothetical protein